MSSIKIGILVNYFIVRILLYKLFYIHIFIYKLYLYLYKFFYIQAFVIAAYQDMDIIKKCYSKRWIDLSTK